MSHDPVLKYSLYVKAPECDQYTEMAVSNPFDYAKALSEAELMHVEYKMSVKICVQELAVVFEEEA